MTARGWLRQAVAFARSAEPRTPVSRRAVAGDVALAAAFLVASLIEVARLVSAGGGIAHLVPVPADHGRYYPQVKIVVLSATRVRWLAALAAVGTTAPLAARRVTPLT